MTRIRNVSILFCLLAGPSSGLVSGKSHLASGFLRTPPTVEMKVKELPSFTDYKNVKVPTADEIFVDNIVNDKELTSFGEDLLITMALFQQELLRARIKKNETAKTKENGNEENRKDTFQQELLRAKIRNEQVAKIKIADNKENGKGLFQQELLQARIRNDRLAKKYKNIQKAKINDSFQQELLRARLRNESAVGKKSNNNKANGKELFQQPSTKIKQTNGETNEKVTRKKSSEVLPNGLKKDAKKSLTQVVQGDALSTTAKKATSKLDSSKKSIDQNASRKENQSTEEVKYKPVLKEGERDKHDKKSTSISEIVKGFGKVLGNVLKAKADKQTALEGKAKNKTADVHISVNSKDRDVSKLIGDLVARKKMLEEKRDFVLHQRLLNARLRNEMLDKKRLHTQEKKVGTTKTDQFQEQLLVARLKGDLSAKLRSKEKRRFQFQQKLLNARMKNDAAAKSLLDKNIRGGRIEEKEAAKKEAKEVKSYEFQKRLLEARLKYEQDEKAKNKSRLQEMFHRKLLEKRYLDEHKEKEKFEKVAEEIDTEMVNVVETRLAAAKEIRLEAEKEAELKAKEADQARDAIQTCLAELESAKNAQSNDDAGKIAEDEDRAVADYLDWARGHKKDLEDRIEMQKKEAARFEYEQVKYSKKVGFINEEATRVQYEMDAQQTLIKAEMERLEAQTKQMENLEYIAKMRSGEVKENPDGPSPLVGRVMNEKYVITEELKTASDKCDIFTAYRTTDVAQQWPLIVKLTEVREVIQLEYRINQDLFHRLNPEEEHLFVKVHEWIEPRPNTEMKAGFVMECGLENLRGYIWRNGPYTGEKLRKAFENIIRIVYALHKHDVVWTELKAENFIVFDGDRIKGADLESIAAHGEPIRIYTAEAYPPEFPADDLYNCLPQIPLDYSYDMWGLGLTLFEVATGQPFWTLERTYDIEYIKSRLKDPEGIIAEVHSKLWNIDAGARNVITRCLVLDPKERCTCEELLNDIYFTRGI